jgi:basic amino acid/polyamine antiporter, APA family
MDTLFGVTLSESITLPPGEGGDVNVPAFLLVLAVAGVLIAGIRQSARSNTVMVVIKLVVLFFFIAVALSAFDGDHFSDFAPNGWTGIENAAALIFFAYIGFDAVSTGREETRIPGRDLPIAIIGSLVIATIIYILVSVAAVGALPPDQLAGQDAPLAVALSEGAGIQWGADIVTFGALVAITSVVLTILYGQTRVAFSMCRDGLMPPRLATVWEKTRTPGDPHAAVRRPHRGPRRIRAAQGDRRAGQHRHAVRLLHRQHRRDLAAAHEARDGARVSRAARPRRPDHRRPAVRLPDDEAAK